MDFAQFYAASWGPCYQAVLVTEGDPATAEELLAEAFARALASWRSLQGHPAPRAWVVRTAVNAGVSSWRKRRREVALSARPVEAAPEPGGAPNEALLGAIMRLPRREREVIALRFFLDLDTESTASQLGIAPGTVRAHLARAMAALRQQQDLFAAKEVVACTTTMV